MLCSSTSSLKFTTINSSFVHNRVPIIMITLYMYIYNKHTRNYFSLKKNIMESIRIQPLRKKALDPTVFLGECAWAIKALCHRNDYDFVCLNIRAIWQTIFSYHLTVFRSITLFCVVSPTQSLLGSTKVSIISVLNGIRSVNILVGLRVVTINEFIHSV